MGHATYVPFPYLLSFGGHTLTGLGHVQTNPAIRISGLPRRNAIEGDPYRAYPLVLSSSWLARSSRSLIPSAVLACLLVFSRPSFSSPPIHKPHPLSQLSPFLSN